MINKYLSNQEIKDIKNNYMYSEVYNKYYFKKLLKKKEKIVKKKFIEITKKNINQTKNYTIEVKVLNNIIKKINILNLDIKKISFVVKKKKFLEKTKTEKFLSNLLINYYKNKKSKNIYEIIYRILKKFEVSKKLYTAYDKKFEKRKSNKEDINSLMIFILLLMQVYINKIDDLRYINCLFKISDKILYKYNKKFNQNEIFLILYFNFYLILKLKKKYEAKL